ncbi:unnamed protein product [Effrenium voratum]|uniref:peptidylprolyl isomerase n=1 Tax=Effrenium voratum TaxID=2562239 RepID=A0AA36IZC9_9DINO|nr:unnamed protein product [Effrenium voratum]
MGPLAKRADSGPVPLREAEVGGVRVAIFREGTGRRPQESCSCHLVGRLASNGCVFESTAGKGQGPMRMELKKNAIIPGMELALQELSLGSVAEIRIPPELAYGKNGIPRIVPPSSELLFEIQLVQVDDEDCEPSQAEGPRVEKRSDGEICHGWWLARVHLLPPPSYYLNFCKYLAGSERYIPHGHWDPRWKSKGL